MSAVLLIVLASVGQPNFEFQKNSYDQNWNIAIDEIPAGETLNGETVEELDRGAYLVNFQVRIESGEGNECFARVRCSQGVPGSSTTKLHLYTKDFRVASQQETWNFFFLVPKFEVVAKDTVTYQVEVGYKLRAPLLARNVSGQVLVDAESQRPLYDLSQDKVVRSIAWQFGSDEAVNTEQDHEVERLDLPSILWNGLRGSFLIYSAPAPGLELTRLVYETMAPSKGLPEAVAPGKQFPTSGGIPTYVSGPPGALIKVGITEKLPFPSEGEKDALRLLPRDPVLGERVESSGDVVVGGDGSRGEILGGERQPALPAASLPVAADRPAPTTVSQPPASVVSAPAVTPAAFVYSYSAPRYVAPTYGFRYQSSTPPRRSLLRFFARGR